MHRFYVPEVRQGEARFAAAQVHQIRDVLRLRDAEEVAVFDGMGREWVAAIRGAVAELLREVDGPVEPETRLTIYQALIKPARWEMVLQ
ncbi:MAG: RNA methyltransferase PUA domain-containing protein, partial [Chloroflexota bacterium]